ncbi:MAG: aminotransferase class I/II-fold pyridoxal phosphate-dependent enzyme [Candidatus Heimdallarchaeum aukensis]|uniref:Aminotransferase class I/II-fold pyridoxal phosphate-dependent enzyme n=1 Tax=Candidatus Heimdallarchaeum aukensis TaxID=2876573 RepID=A0A9Y1FLV0_9ARCH|nr:MAG: aminotransferase class I/II-fold pyridoxal phosphate-dependent enzyme [Candidatus Heimdallarchaeum aukensis]
MNKVNYLSEKGMFIEKNVNLSAGTLAWGSKARQRAKEVKDFIDATIGSAKSDEGKLFAFKTFEEELKGLPADKMFGYANVRGQKRFTRAWMEDTLETFPSEYREKSRLLSTEPITTCGGITGGLTIAGQLFFDKTDNLLVPNSRWSNVDNCFFKNQQITELNYNLIDIEGNLSFDDLIEKIKLLEKENKKIGIYFNFPNNPSGISPTLSQIKEIQETLEEVKVPTVIILDDAYEGYVYSDDVLDHSIYPYLIGLNENVLTIKVDGMSKRYSAYGVRLGTIMLGFGKEVDEKEKEDYRELIAKGARSLTSSSPRGPQEAFANISEDKKKKEQLKKEKEELKNLLKERYLEIKALIKDKEHDTIHPVDFNSGFFGYWIIKNDLLSFDLGEKLLERGLGTVPFYNNTTGLNGIRLAFCSIKRDDLEKAIDILYSI